MMEKMLYAVLMVMALTLAAEGQSLDDRYGKDVKTIDAIIDAYYDVISGSASDPWQFERDRYLHSANAVIIKIDENGVAERHSLEAEYVPFLLAPRTDFYEVELKRDISTFGSMAQVWSAYEVRTDPDRPTQVRGLNSIQLHFSSGRWWIDGWTSEMETGANPLVSLFLNQP